MDPKTIDVRLVVGVTVHTSIVIRSVNFSPWEFGDCRFRINVLGNLFILCLAVNQTILSDRYKPIVNLVFQNDKWQWLVRQKWSFIRWKSKSPRPKESHGPTA